MANGSLEDVFALLAAAFVGLVGVEATLRFGKHRAAARSQRIVATRMEGTSEGPPPPGSGP